MRIAEPAVRVINARFAALVNAGLFMRTRDCAARRCGRVCLAKNARQMSATIGLSARNLVWRPIEFIETPHCNRDSIYLNFAQSH